MGNYTCNLCAGLNQQYICKVVRNNIVCLTSIHFVCFGKANVANCVITKYLT